jgi:hypothetical protein
MEHLHAYLKELGPWAATIAFGILIKMLRRLNKVIGSLAETRFKADECHEELCKREPEYARALAAWKTHRKTF